MAAQLDTLMINVTVDWVHSSTPHTVYPFPQPRPFHLAVSRDIEQPKLLIKWSLNMPQVASAEDLILLIFVYNYEAFLYSSEPALRPWMKLKLTKRSKKK